MDPIDNRIIVQLINTCFICRRMYVAARDLNQHLQQDHHLAIERYNRLAPLHIEMIPTEHYIFLNMLAPNFDNASHFAVFVTTISPYGSTSQSRNPQERARETRELDLSFEFFDTHHLNHRPNEAAHHQQGDAAVAFENQNGGFKPMMTLEFQTGDATINEESFHADDEDSDHAEEEGSDQQDSGHATSGVDSQSNVGDDRSEEIAINDQQELDLQHMDREEEEGFIDNDHRNINLGPSIDAGNGDLNGQPIIGNVAPQERADQGSENNNTALKFIH